MSNSSHPHNWPEAARSLHAEIGEGSLHANVRELLAASTCERVLVDRKSTRLNSSH